MTPAGIELATFRFVAQHLNHCATAVPRGVCNNTINAINVGSSPFPLLLLLLLFLLFFFFFFFFLFFDGLTCCRKFHKSGVHKLWETLKPSQNFSRLKASPVLSSDLFIYCMEQSPYWEAADSQLVEKYPAVIETRRFITVVTTACHLSLSWASSIQPMFPHLTPWRYILILSSHLSLDLPSGPFASGYWAATPYEIQSSWLTGIRNSYSCALNIRIYFMFCWPCILLQSLLITNLT